ncbi:crotonobetainyl-CoA:carnitine CoA-transferase CaiB-like acyl-CoA transferase [Bradyrhizobium sp. USDA 4469]
MEGDPQIAHLGIFYELDHPTMGRVRGIHRPFSIDGEREIDFRPPPTLGEHQNELLAGNPVKPN